MSVLDSVSIVVCFFSHIYLEYVKLMMIPSISMKL